MIEGNIILQKGRSKPVLQHHPWVFSGSIDTQRSTLDDTPPGGIVDVRGTDGGFLARGYYSPHSQIRVRLLTWDQNDAMGPVWWRVGVARAIARRAHLARDEHTTAYRLINAESDGLPGLIVDRYGEYLVLQALTVGVEVVKDAIVDALADLLEPLGIYERSDAGVRELEGLADAAGLLWGDPPPELVPILENGLTYLVDIVNGHKTGFYLDQRDSRAWVLNRPTLEGGRVLNCFSYTGGFSAAAFANGAAHVTDVDTSEPAQAIAQQVMEANGLPAVEAITADVFDMLRDFRDEEERFDLIVLDPPKFAHSRSQVQQAARGYKDINMLALELLEPGGLLLTFSCSSHVDADLFQKIVFGASADAGVNAQIVKWFAQPEDHPVLLTFPEGRYLKGLACRVMG